MQAASKYQSIETCAICNGCDLEILWDLPRFPLTEKFGAFDPKNTYNLDQKLLICMNCGHVQLQNQLDPFLLYTPDEYAFRTNKSKTALQGTEFFYNFFLT